MTRDRISRGSCIVLVATLGLITPPARACDVERWAPDISEAGIRFHVEPNLIRSVMMVESDACQLIDGHRVTSDAGAMGLMQLMPDTWSTYRERLHLGNDPYDPHDNILAGGAFLSDLVDRFGLLNSIAAYFAGPGTVLSSQAGQATLSVRTLDYVRDVLSHLTPNLQPTALPASSSKPKNDSLFAVRRTQKRHDINRTSASPSTLLAIDHGHGDDVTSSSQSHNLAPP